MNRKTLAAAFPHTVPVLMGYLSIGIVFGWMMSAAGFVPLWSAAMSLTIYAGSGQYLGVDLLANASPLADVAFLTLIINFRHLVYGLSMLEKFRDIKGLRKLYMIFALTDETYALPSPCWTSSTGSPGPSSGRWRGSSSPSTPRASTSP